MSEPIFWMCDVKNVQQKAGQSSGTSWTYFESLWAEDNSRTFVPLIYVSEVEFWSRFGEQKFWTEGIPDRLESSQSNTGILCQKRLRVSLCRLSTVNYFLITLPSLLIKSKCIKEINASLNDEDTF